MQIVGELPLNPGEALALLASLQSAPESFVLTDINGENPIAVTIAPVSAADLGALGTQLSAQTMGELEAAIAQGRNRSLIQISEPTRPYSHS